MPLDVSGDHAADTDAPVQLSGGGIVVEAADGSRGQVERVGRRLGDLDIADASHEERDAAQLFGRPEQGADVAAQVHFRIDETLEVVRGVFPEPCAHDTVLVRHIRKQRVHRGIG